MFNRLLRNLPFNPSLIDQVSFYGKRLRKENSLRRIGFGFVALAMVVQIFGFVTPSEASNQCSSNDVIRCGFKTKDEAVQKCNANTYGFGSILTYYGISCATLGSAATKTIGATDQGDQLYSMGRNAYQKRGEYPVAIPNAGTFYLRHLSSWGNISPKVLVMQTPDNKPFMVMYDCGNIVILGGYTPPAVKEPSAALKLVKVAQPAGVVKPGDTIKYTLAFTNTGGTAAFFSVNDVLPDTMEYVGSEYGNWVFERNGQALKWYNNTPPYYTFGNTVAFGTPGFITVSAKVKSNVPSGTTICNRGWLGDIDTATKQVRGWGDVTACNTVVVDCPGGTIPGPNGQCTPVAVADATCLYLQNTGQSSRTKFSFETKAQVLNGATIKSYSYNFGDGSKGLIKQSTSVTDTVKDYDFKKPGTYTVTVTIGTSVAPKPGLICKTAVTVKPEDIVVTPIPVRTKKASNITQSISDANNTVAKAGDVIEYSLTTTNKGDGELKNGILQSEKLADVLEYADIDLTRLDGGVFESASQELSWNKPVSLKPGQSVTKTFRVTIKSPIPQTLRPNNAPGASYDMVLTNEYGNVVNIKLPTTVLKTTETINNTTLTNTGPGEAVIISGLIAMTVGYFFARGRLLSKEIDIVRNEYATASGGL